MRVRVALPLLLLLVTSVACSQTIDTTIQDAAITAAVKTALLNEPSVDGTRVDVRTIGGVVYLSGSAASAEEAATFVALVRGVAGVRSVEASGLSPTPRF